jgi:hypothetical protein
MTAGRKRKKCQREPNGRPQRPTVVAQNEIVRERNDAVMSVVLAQPHRLGSRSQQRESPWGRFCEDHKLRREIYDGGNAFADLLRRWRAAKGVPTDLRVSEGGNGQGPSDATVKGWTERLASIRLNVVLQTSPGAWLAVEMLLVDRIELPKASIRDGVIGGAALAVEIGAMSARSSPFGT